MIPLPAIDPAARVDFWLDAKPEHANDLGYLRGERARLLRTVLRRWARQNGCSMRDAFVVQFPPEVFAHPGTRRAQVRFTFAVGPDLSRLGGPLPKGGASS